MAVFVPQGLGMGCNVETHANQQAAHAQAMRVLAPRWSYSWSRLAVGPNYVPAIFPEWEIIPARDLAVWRVQMIDAGLQWDQLTWTFCNEPENSNMEPREIARAIVRQLYEFDNANIRLRVITPNGNINTQRSLNFGIDLFQRTRQAGVLLAPACHVWCGAQYVPQVWARYREWIEGYGDKLDAHHDYGSWPWPNVQHGRMAGVHAASLCAPRRSAGRWACAVQRLPEDT